MKENQRRSIVLIIIAIATLALVVGAATFAFFATRRDIDNGVINANLGTAASMYSFSAESNGNIEIDILFNEMSEAKVSTNVLKTDNATIDVKLSSPSEGMKTTCTYDIVWVWDSTGDNIYTSPDVSLTYTHTDNKVYPYEFSAKVDANEEKDLSKYSTSGKVVTLQKDVTIESTSTVAIEKQHKIDAYIYNLPVDQLKLFDKQFRAHITIDNLSCSMEGGSTSAETILAYWNDGFSNTTYTHPNTPSTIYESVEEMQEKYNIFSSRPYYIKTTNKEYQACLYYNNKEFCLSKGYWDTDVETTARKIQTEMARTLGISEDSLDCYTLPQDAYCIVDYTLSCGALSDGMVDCYGDGSTCYVTSEGNASCDLW